MSRFLLLVLIPLSISGCLQASSEGVSDSGAQSLDATSEAPEPFQGSYLLEADVSSSGRVTFDLPSEEFLRFSIRIDTFLGQGFEVVLPGDCGGWVQDGVSVHFLSGVTLDERACLLPAGTHVIHASSTGSFTARLGAVGS